MRALLAAALLLAAHPRCAWAELAPERVAELVEKAKKGDTAARATLEAEVMRLKGLSAAGWLEPAGAQRLYLLHQTLGSLPRPASRPGPAEPEKSPGKAKPKREKESAVPAQTAGTMLVRRITVVAYRTDHAALMRHIPIREGDSITAKDLHETRESLYRMHMFKDVAVFAVPMEGGGVEVRVEVKDGWFIIPIPFYFGGSGGSRGGVFFSARNIFRQAEAFSASGILGRTASRGAFSAEWEGWIVSASYLKNDFTERAYLDGGYSSTTGLGEPIDSADPGKLGTVVHSYAKSIRETEVSVEVPLWRGRDYIPLLSVEFGWEDTLLRQQRIQGLDPGDSGQLGHVMAGFKLFQETALEGDLGQILGYGLADLETRIRPLRRSRWRTPISVRGFIGEKWFRNRFRYRKIVIRWDPSVTWGMHNLASAYFFGSRGVGLPNYRFPTTTQGLLGDYAREFRGLAVLGMGARVARPLWTTRLGILRAAAFGEKARAFNRGMHQDMAGFGGSLFYVFWRFPIPLGVTYTYSINDKSSEVSATMGGRF